MDDATQKLGSEAGALREAARVLRGEFQPLVNRVPDWRNVERQLLEAADALEAAEENLAALIMGGANPPHESVCRCGATGNGECVRPPVTGDYTHVVNLARASEAADKGFDALVDYLADLPTIEEWRPPVSTEVREEIAAVLFDADEHHDGTEAAFRNEAHTIGGGHNRAVARAQADAILARFSFPSQPVYDEEKIARFLWRFHPDSICDHWDWLVDMHPALAAEYRRRAAALVAALRGGELTREETNE